MSDERRVTWLATATEWAEETIENGPSAYIAPATAEALAQTVMALTASPASPQGAQPDFNQEVNLHADTIAERHDSQQGVQERYTLETVHKRIEAGDIEGARAEFNAGIIANFGKGAQEGGSESIRQSVKKMNEQVAHDAKMFEDAHSAPPSAPASAAPEQRSAMPEEPPLIRALRHTHPRNRYGPLSQYDANEILQHVDALRAHASALTEQVERLQNERAYVPQDAVILNALCDLTLSALEQREWIPVSERLPERFEPVLVACKDQMVGMSHVRFVPKSLVTWNGQWSLGGTCIAHDAEITHWMPLPAAPSLATAEKP